MTVRAMHRGAAVPSPAELHPILCKVSERLARELAKPGRTAPDWSDSEWTIARAVAAMHGISPLLSNLLPWRGPEAWKTFLDEQRTHTRARHRRIDELLRSIDQKSHEMGIAATALKGAELHRLGLYEAGDRPMADVDLLVRPADGERAVAMLAALGYRQSGESWKERVFTPIEGSTAAQFGEHAGNGMKIELHERICERLPWHLTDISQSIFPAEPQPGLNDYPSNASLMRHLLLHAAGSMAFRSLRILQLHDIALLTSHMGHGDWDEFDCPKRSFVKWWALPPIEMMTRYYGPCVPARIMTSLADQCPRVLRALESRRSLVDVSLSNPWVKAFPGVEWSHSVFELVAYTVNRIRPGSQQLSQRKYTADNQNWAKESDWMNASQGSRIVRWLTSRQTRPVTMHAIAAAFARSS